MLHFLFGIYWFKRIQIIKISKKVFILQNLNINSNTLFLS
jgi:hypothetical protein